MTYSESESATLGPSTRPVKLITGQIDRPSLDTRIYRVILLANRLEVLLCHDATADKASAAMDVRVGNFSDEEDMPGMAHAVEHLLFMGTEKYPVENDYSQYLSSFSGCSNAYTSSTSTNYYFEVAAKLENDQEPLATNPSPLYGALDRFAQFFIKPLFLANTLDRELRAVDSENKKNLQSDLWRLSQLEKTLSNPCHPYHKFATGSFNTLKTIPESRGVDVRQKFIEFYDKQYSANRMKLVVLGREPLDVLEAWVAEFFSDIVDKDLPPNRWVDEVPLTPEHLGTQYFARPVMDSRELTLTFPIPDEEFFYETQPSRYVVHLIGHEGPGSIMAYLKAKGWANSLLAGAYVICPGTSETISCEVRLTEEGLKNYKEVVKVIFQYIALLREAPPQRWIFEEEKGIADVDFKFQQQIPPMSFTSKISAIMQRSIPREWLLHAYSRPRRFDPDLIQNTLDCLRPDNFRLSVVSRTFPGKWEKKEKWYGTEYTYNAIPTDFMAEIKQAAAISAEMRIPELHLPHKNQFIPTNLEVDKKEVKEPAIAPRLIRNDERARTWYKKDDTFWVPKANLYISCRNPLVSATAENIVKTRFFAELVRDALEEYSYDAELAGLDYTVTFDSRGLCVEVSGYNDKLPVLLEKVLVTMRDLELMDDRFLIIKERVTRAFKNWALQPPWHQVGDYLNWLTSERARRVEDLRAELPAVTADDVRVFRKQLLSQLHFEILAHGNLVKKEALMLTEMVERILQPRVLPRTQWPIQRSLILPPGSNYLYTQMLEDPANVNHCLEYLLDICDRTDPHLRTRTLLLHQICHEPVFDQLRTKEQLGYVVFSGVLNSTTRVGYRFLIQSEKTGQFLESRIDSFLVGFAETLRKMSDSDFENHKRSLIIRRLEKPKTLTRETSRYWTQIVQEYFDFELGQKDAAGTACLTKNDMIEFFDQYIHPKSPTRAKLSVCLVAQSKSDVSTKQISELVVALELDGETATQVATDLQARLSAAGHDEAKEIQDLAQYLGGLQISEAQIDRAITAWKKLHTDNATNTHVNGDANDGQFPVSPNGTTPYLITDIRAFKAGLGVSAGALPVKDLSEYEDLEAKL